MSQKDAEKFFDKLWEEKSPIRGDIKKGLEDLAKKAGYDATEDELNAELRKRWNCTGWSKNMYSEPPGF
jgi:hypothetical protein